MNDLASSYQKIQLIPLNKNESELMMQKKNNSLDLLNTKLNNKIQYQFSKNNIESLITDYIETGTATRKFDGISVKLENNKIRYLYSGGLNAQNCIKAIPIHQQIESNNGDNSIVVEDDDALL